MFHIFFQKKMDETKPKTELILSLSEHFSGKAGAQGAVPNAIFGSTEGN